MHLWRQNLDVHMFILLGLFLANGLWTYWAWRQKDVWSARWAGGLAVIVLTGLGLYLSADPGLIVSSVGRLLAVLVNPASLCVAVCLGVALFLWQPGVFTRPQVVWAIINLVLVGVVLGDGISRCWATFADSESFAVLAMAGLSLFFLGYGLRLAAENDRRLREKAPVWEASLAEKVPTWPNLVYIELIAALVVLTLILLWSLAYPAPLEAPANPAWTPNPAKAPWYFVGIQEWLVYFDATMAGVILPGVLILGLILLPYLDLNPKGNGYYTLRERPWAISVFVFGFVVIWWLPIITGFFFRGPNWNFSVAGVDKGAAGAETAVTLSQLVWRLLIDGSPAGIFTQQHLAARLPVLIRELPGLAVLGSYLVVVPLVLEKGLLRPQRERLGAWRYWASAWILLLLASLPLKIILRHLAGISYVVAMPEYNIHL